MLNSVRTSSPTDTFPHGVPCEPTTSQQPPQSPSASSTGNNPQNAQKRPANSQQDQMRGVLISNRSAAHTGIMHAEQASHTRTDQSASTTHDSDPRRNTRHRTRQTGHRTGNTNQAGHQIRPTTSLSIERRHIIITAIRALIRDHGLRSRLTRQHVIRQHSMLCHKHQILPIS